MPSGLKRRAGREAGRLAIVELPALCGRGEGKVEIESQWTAFGRGNRLPEGVQMKQGEGGSIPRPLIAKCAMNGGTALRWAPGEQAKETESMTGPPATHFREIRRSCPAGIADATKRDVLLRIIMRRILGVVLLLSMVAFENGWAVSPHHDYVPDERTAERIAEAVLIAQFGQDRVKAQMPLHASSMGKDQWFVQGVVKDRKGRPQVGGNFGVWVNKHAGCVRVVEHAK